eukprot:Sro156_g070620.1 Abscisic acid 8'-hydroxylase (493) ;mRNA; f:9022-10500
MESAITGNSSISVLAWGILTLGLCNWLRLEINTILLRSKLPRGDLGLLFLGNLYEALVNNPANIWYDQRAKFGRFFSTNGVSLHVTGWTAESTAWLWNVERKGGAVTSWPPQIQKLTGKTALTNVNGAHHRALRRILEPAFTPKATRDYVKTIDTVMQQTFREWSERDTTISSDDLKLLTLRVFLLAAFGKELEPNTRDVLHRDFKIWTEGFGSIIPYRLPFTQFAKSMDARDRIRKTLEEVIIQFKKDNPPGSFLAETTMVGRACYGLDEEGKTMSMEELKDNLLAMIFAGHDTTSASMGTAIHFLCENHAIRQALTEEVKGFKKPLDFDELKAAPILNAFLAECWRRDPPAMFIFRKLQGSWNHEGFQLPSGLRFNISVKLAAWNEELFPQPEKFEIQRFLPKDHPLVDNPELGEAAKSVEFNSDGMKANFPIFGGARHACLGSHFAKVEMRVFVTRLLQSYCVEELSAEKMHSPINGWKTRFQLACPAS